MGQINIYFKDGRKIPVPFEEHVLSKFYFESDSNNLNKFMYNTYGLIVVDD